MSPHFENMSGAEGWQLSNPPILPMACLRASFELFDEAGMDNLRLKSMQLGNVLFNLMDEMDHPKLKIITPRSEAERGCQISIQLKDADKTIFNKITEAGVIADWREPDVIRLAPVPLYNSFTDIFDFIQILKQALND